MDLNTSICINNPIWYSSKAESHYLGLRKIFLDKYVKFIYFTPLNFLRWASVTDFSALRYVISSKKILFSIDEINNRSDVFLTLNEKFSDDGNFVNGIKALKINALYDYNINVKEIINKIRKFNIDVLIGQGSHDINCTFYKHFITPLDIPLIFSPFGWKENFEENVSSNKHVDLSVLGAIAPIKNRPKNEIPGLEEYLKFFNEREFSRLYRRWFFDNKQHLSSNIKIELPDSIKSNRLVNVNESEILGKSFSTFIDCGSLNFLPARFYEALGHDVIPITNIGLQFSELGFEKKNSFVIEQLDISVVYDTISLIKENYQHILSEYKKYKSELTFEAVATRLYKDIERLIK